MIVSVLSEDFFYMEILSSIIQNIFAGNLLSDYIETNISIKRSAACETVRLSC